jgi:hypothetical protein
MRARSNKSLKENVAGAGKPANGTAIAAGPGGPPPRWAHLTRKAIHSTTCSWPPMWVSRGRPEMARLGRLASQLGEQQLHRRRNRA